MYKQKGITLSGFLLWAMVLVFIALIGFKVGPSYFENMSIQKQFKAIVNDPSRPVSSLREAQIAFSGRATVENITAINAGDIEFSKDGDRVTLSASYTVCVPLVSNMKACMDFSPSSDK
ncbi:MAG: DUF4845 domain-containing protein [Pseudomonadota bacterium]|mgnify:FL=1